MATRSLLPFGDVDPFLPLQREINRMFSDFSTGSFSQPQLKPRMDVVERDKEIEITAELPGLEEKDVDVSLSDGVLTIRGEKKLEKEEKASTRHVYERSYGSFSRSVELPDVKPDEIKAVLEKGVLKVTFPKPAERKSQAKKIEVKSAKA